MMSSQKYSGYIKKYTQGENEQNRQALDQFEQTFADQNKQQSGMQFIKGGILDQENKKLIEDDRGDIYRMNAQQKEDINRNVVIRSLQQQNITKIQKNKNIDLILDKFKHKNYNQQDKLKDVRKDDEQQGKQQKSNQFTGEQVQNVFEQIGRQLSYSFSMINQTYITINDVSEKLNEQFVRSLCEPYGQIEQIIFRANYIVDEIRARLTCFVKFKNTDQSRIAQQELNSKIVQGEHLRVLQFMFGRPIEPDIRFISTIKTIEDSDQIKRITIKLPLNYFLKRIIDKLAKITAYDGLAIEQYMNEKERDNRILAFLFYDCPEQLYYKFKVFSIIQDRQNKYDPFQFSIGNIVYIPPTYQEEQDLERQFSQSWEKVKKDKVKIQGSVGSQLMPENLRLILEERLFNINTQRITILEIMVFCMDNAAYAADIVMVISSSLSLQSITLNQCLARLYLISDLLQNCQIQSNVNKYWAYHLYFQYKLPMIFELINECIVKNTHKDQVKGIQEKIIRVLQIWLDWAVYDKKYIIGLLSTFYRSRNDLMFQEYINPKGLILKILEAKIQGRDKLLLQKNCLSRGLIDDGSKDSLIARLVRFKEFQLIFDKKFIESDTFQPVQIIELMNSFQQKMKKSISEKESLYQCLKEKIKQDEKLHNIDGDDLTDDDISKIRNNQVTIVSFYDMNNLFEAKQINNNNNNNNININNNNNNNNNDQMDENLRQYRFQLQKVGLYNKDRINELQEIKKIELAKQKENRGLKQVKLAVLLKSDSSSSSSQSSESSSDSEGRVRQNKKRNNKRDKKGKKSRSQSRKKDKASQKKRK